VARWFRKGGSADAPIYFVHRIFNSGHQLVVCRPRDGRDVCLEVMELGEDQLELPFLRSQDGRYLFWPFGGSVFNLETLQPLTASRAVPATQGLHFDFEVDRPALTLAVEGRLVSFVANAAGDTWTRSDEERASPPFGVLSLEGGKKALHTLASLGGRQYLAVRSDGVLARLDAVTGREVWRIAAVGLGDIQDVQLNPERRDVLLMGKSAWRIFRLADGFAVSGLLAPPLRSNNQPRPQPAGSKTCWGLEESWWPVAATACSRGNPECSQVISDRSLRALHAPRN